MQLPKFLNLITSMQITYQKTPQVTISIHPYSHQHANLMASFPHTHMHPNTLLSCIQTHKLPSRRAWRDKKQKPIHPAKLPTGGWYVIIRGYTRPPRGKVQGIKNARAAPFPLYFFFHDEENVCTYSKRTAPY